MKNGLMIAVLVLLIAGIVAISGCTSSSNSTSDEPPFQVGEFTVSEGSYGMWDVDGSITPNKDMSYIEVVTIWYDSSGAVINRDPLAWNINDAKAGQTLKIHSSTSLYEKGTPAKVDVLFFDSALAGGDDSEAVYTMTINLN